MQETHLWLSSVYDKDQQLLIDEYSNEVVFDLSVNEYESGVHLCRQDVQLLVSKLNAWLAK